MQNIKFILFLILFFCINTEAQNNVAVVIEVKGTARLREINGKETKLTEKNYVASLTVGQSLKADRRGQVRIKLCNGRTEIVGNKWYSIRQIICAVPKATSKRRAFEIIFTLGARVRIKRGGDEFILFPIESPEIPNIIRPETVVLRWIATKEELTLSINVAGKDEPFWSQAVPGAPRLFNSNELRSALEEIRKKHPDKTFQLKIKIPSLKTENSADFQILSLNDEKELREELAAVDKEEQGVFRYLARAEIYSRYKLYIEEASEYEKALALSPESIDLLNTAAWAQDRVGNFAKRDAIDSKIKALSKNK